MKILMVSATKLEIQPLLNEFELIREINQHLSSYQDDQIRLDVLITGVGMVSTVYQLTKTLNTFDYDFVINAGIAGSFKKDLKLGDVVHINVDQLSELGAQDGEYFLSLVDLNLLEKDEFPFKDLKLINPEDFNNETIAKLPKAKGITVNTVHGDKHEIEKIISRFSPDIESMEGAAFMYVCMLENISFAQIRSISNYVEQRNTQNWDIPKALKTLNYQLKSILQHAI